MNTLENASSMIARRASYPTTSTMVVMTHQLDLEMVMASNSVLLKSMVVCDATLGTQIFRC
jgi:hypothetical protein